MFRPKYLDCARRICFRLGCMARIVSHEQLRRITKIGMADNLKVVPTKAGQATGTDPSDPRASKNVGVAEAETPHVAVTCGVLDGPVIELVFWRHGFFARGGGGAFIALSAGGAD